MIFSTGVSLWDFWFVFFFNYKMLIPSADLTSIATCTTTPLSKSVVQLDKFLVGFIGQVSQCKKYPNFLASTLLLGWQAIKISFHINQNKSDQRHRDQQQIWPRALLTIIAMITFWNSCFILQTSKSGARSEIIPSLAHSRFTINSISVLEMTCCHTQK